MNTPNVTVSGSVFGDIEYQMLADELGLPMVADVVGRVTFLEAWCLKNGTDTPSRRIVDAHLGKGGAAALLAVELAVEVEGGGLRVRGTGEKLDEWKRYIAGKQRAGIASGVARAAKAVDVASTDSATSVVDDKPPHQSPNRTRTDGQQDRTGHEQTVNRTEQDTNRNEHSSLISPDLPSPVLETAEPPKPPKGGSRRPARLASSDSERAAAGVVLRKLGEQTGTEYRGSDKHVRLIISRYRDGFDELDLRKVIAYASRTPQEGGLGWNADERMRMFLRPETLFGPETIERYADAARSWFKQRIAAELQPSPEFQAWRAEQAPRLAVVK